MLAYYKVILIISILVLIGFSADRLIAPATTDAHREAAAAYVDMNNVPVPPRAFSQDGCSLAPETVFGHDLTAACLAHDVAYWAGGSDELRAQRDLEFKDAIAHTGPLGRPLSVVYYTSVRLFGDSLLTRAVGANWGYGWNK